MRVSDPSERLVYRLVVLARSPFTRSLNGDTIADPDRALRARLQARNYGLGDQS